MKAIQLTDKDTVATVLQDTAAGDVVTITVAGQTIGEVKALEAIPFGFKICTASMKAGDNVIKYAHVIGYATEDVPVGSLVHVHNIQGGRGRGDLNKE